MCRLRWHGFGAKPSSPKGAIGTRFWWPDSPSWAGLGPSVGLYKSPLLMKINFFFFLHGKLAVFFLTSLLLFFYDVVDALQELWGAWNKSTPDPSNNLAGWSSSQPYPCPARLQWQGVTCSRPYHDSVLPKNSYLTRVTGL